MSAAVAILTRGMVAPAKIVPQPYTAESPTVPTIVHVKPKIRSVGLVPNAKPKIKKVE